MSTANESARQTGEKRSLNNSSANDAPIHPTPKFSKGSAGDKVVPNVVPVDFGAPQEEQPQPTPTMNSAPQQRANNERPIASRLDWKLIKSREALEKVLRVQKFNKKNAAYISVDVAAYKQLTGISVTLDQFNHLRIKSPFMMNIFGISSRTVQGKTTHSINYGVSDGSFDADVAEFAEWLALVDDVLLDKCVQLVIESPEVRSKVDWVDDCTDDETKKINTKKLRAKIAKNFHGALRCSQKKSQEADFKPVTINADGSANIPDCFWFRSKIRSNSSCEQMLDVTCVTNSDVPQIVFYRTIEELFQSRATYVQAVLELPAIYFVQKELYATWTTRKIKFEVITSNKDDNNAAPVDDFADGATPHVFSSAAIEAVKREEEALREKIANGAEIASQTVTEGDEGGF